MGCGSCGTGANGKPAGCQSNGGCSSGGCNRFNVFDWLGNIPLADGARPYPIVEVSFNKGSRKEYYRNNTYTIFEKGQMIAVEGVSGFDIGMVSLTGELVKLQMKKYGVKDDSNIKRILRLSTEEDLKIHHQNKEREQAIMVRSRAIARQMKLEMKICEVEIQSDGKKATFFYTADARVDFRELIKTYATEFKVKVEMKQIGARQESAKIGGIGSCGRELCCSTWLTDFKSVNTTAARYQNLSINQAKLSGQCGRLKCCLNFELDTYMDALRNFPEGAETLETAKGNAYLQKKDIFKNLMWYSFRDSNKQYPLSIARVKEIQKLNKEGKKPEELQPEELESTSHKSTIKAEMGFVNDVGQISLRALEKSPGKKKHKNKLDRPQPSGGGGQQKKTTAPAPQAKPSEQRQTSHKPNPQQEGKGKPTSGRPPQNNNSLKSAPQRRNNRPNQPPNKGTKPE